MDWTSVKVGGYYRITYPNRHNDRRHFGRVVKAVRALPIGDFELAFKNGVKVKYHCCWLEPVSVAVVSGI